MQILKNFTLDRKIKFNTRMCGVKKFLKEEYGLGTVEIVVITAILVGLALIFREYITSFLKKILDGIFKKGESVIN